MNNTTATKVFTIRNYEGIQGRPWARDYDSLEDAAEAIRQEKRWDEVVISDGNEVDRGGERAMVYVTYETQEQADSDNGQMVNQPTIHESI